MRSGGREGPLVVPLSKSTTREVASLLESRIMSERARRSSGVSATKSAWRQASAATKYTSFTTLAG